MPSGLKIKVLLLIGLLIICANDSAAQKNIQHFVFFNMDRDRIYERSFFKEPFFSGAQLKYSWKELEPEKDKYDFSEIEKDLAFLARNDKKLFIQLQDTTFDISRIFVPEYLRSDPKYSGGVNIQYITDNKDRIIRQDGFAARRWDENVARRFHLLLKELGSRFDGRIEGINLPETALGFGDTGKLFPKGFSPGVYRDAILAQMRALKDAFPKSIALQYANYMPGEWLPFENEGYLESVYEFAANHNIAMGGPDIKIYKKSQMDHSYKFLKLHSGVIKTALAVQSGNYEEINPKTGKQVTIEEINKFARDEIDLDYIFWCTQEPFYSKLLIPYLRDTKTPKQQLRDNP